MSTPMAENQRPGPVRRVAVALGTDLLTRANLRILCAAGAVGVLGLVGGFEAAEPETVQVSLAEAGTVSASPVNVEFHGIGEDGYPTVDMTVINTSERPVTALDLGNVFHWSSIDESTYPLLLRTDQTIMGTLNPGVPVDVSLRVPDNAGALQVRSLTWRESSLDGSHRFFDPTIVVEVVL